MKSTSYSCPFGTQHNWLQGGLRQFKAHNREGVPTSIDFSGFDLSTQRFVIETAFELLRKCFHMSTADEELWQIAEEYFINTKIRFGGIDCVLSGGIPSGSVWTHIVGSTISLLLAYYCVDDPVSVKCFGDDLVIWTKSPIILSEFSRWALSLGFEISTGKSSVGEIHWLGFNITGSIPLILDPVKRWAAFFHPEVPDADLSHHKGRLLGYAMSSLGDPRFIKDFMTIWNELEGPAIIPDECFAPEFRGQVVQDLVTLKRVLMKVL